MNKLCSLVVTCVTLLMLGADATPRAEPLQGLFMEVQGKVRWRAAEQEPWREAAVNDLISQVPRFERDCGVGPRFGWARTRPSSWTRARVSRCLPSCARVRRFAPPRR